MTAKRLSAVILLLIFGIIPIVYSQSNYSVSVTQPNPLNIPSICVVTTSGSNNLLVWEKNNSPFTGYFGVYRESTSQTDQWDLLGLIDYSDNSLFVDSSSNPANQSYNYKISAIDLCGNETELSSSHKTMNLSIALGINSSFSLIWSEYEGFNVSSYDIYRGTTESDLKKIASTAAGNFNYNDYNPPLGTVYYQIEVTSPNVCDPTQLKSITTYSSSRSNMVTSETATSSEFWNNENAIKVYPNPLNDRLYVIVPDLEANYIFTLFDLTGKIIHQDKINSSIYKFNRGDIPGGMYLIEVRGSSVYRTKIIIND